MQNIIPWHKKAWQYLLTRKKMERLPHAILLSGREGVGKKHFAEKFACTLLCNNENGVCDGCDACELLKAGNHPDLITISPEDKGKAIKVDQIRDLTAELNNTSHYGGYRVVIIESADLLNMAASNSLLKTLEEPAEKTIIILISANIAVLPATIRSRCQKLLIDPPSHFVAKEWLEGELANEDADADLLLSLSDNSPFKALESLSDNGFLRRKEFLDGLYEVLNGDLNSVQMVKNNLSIGLEEACVIFMRLIGDLIKIKFSLKCSVVNKDQSEILANLAAKTTLDKLFLYKDKLYGLRHHLDRKINLNQQMAMENLVVSWGELFC